jgi:hypothetical protein
MSLKERIVREPHAWIYVGSTVGCVAFGLWWIALLAAWGLASMVGLAVYLTKRRAKIEAKLDSRQYL